MRFSAKLESTRKRWNVLTKRRALALLKVLPMEPSTLPRLKRTIFSSDVHFSLTIALSLKCTRTPFTARSLHFCARAYLLIEMHLRVPVVVSLSGGVDSMVIAKLLWYARKDAPAALVDYLDIYAVHIDYGNRPESAAEAAFLRSWCKSMASICGFGE